MTTTSLLKEPPDFSLVLGGPTYQLLRRAHLEGPAQELLSRRILFIALITWLPLVLLTLIDGNRYGVKLAFLHDIEAHVRFLVAVPVLIAAELIVHRRMRITVKRFVDRGIVRSGGYPVTGYQRVGDRRDKLHQNMCKGKKILVGWGGEQALSSL